METDKMPKYIRNIFWEKKCAVKIIGDFWDLLHYALNRFFRFFLKTYGCTFEKWTFSECPFSDS